MTDATLMRFAKLFFQHFRKDAKRYAVPPDMWDVVIYEAPDPAVLQKESGLVALDVRKTIIPINVFETKRRKAGVAIRFRWGYDARLNVLAIRSIEKTEPFAASPYELTDWLGIVPKITFLS